MAAGEAWRPEAWDLNFGCPAPEILKQGAGAALTRDLGRAWRMAEAMRAATTGPLLFKIRAEEDRGRLLEFVQMLQSAGADAIVVHGRTAREKLCRPAHWEPIAAVAAAVRIPVIGNGDVRSAADAERMFAETGCRGVMIGRAAVERPWIFREIASRWGLPVPALRLRTRSAVYRRLAKFLQAPLLPPARSLPVARVHRLLREELQVRPQSLEGDPERAGRPDGPDAGQELLRPPGGRRGEAVLSAAPWYAAGLRFRCRRCGACCTGAPGYVWLEPADVAAIAPSLGMEPAAVLTRLHPARRWPA